MSSFRFRFASFLEDWAWAVKEMKTIRKTVSFWNDMALRTCPGRNAR